MQTGGCQCGAVRYECASAPAELYLCHCRECQKQSASAFGISCIVPRADFRVTQGAPKFWTRPTVGGGSIECAFCPTCGSRLWHGSGDGTGTVSIKGGSLDSSPDISAAFHIWTSSKFPGVDIPDDARQFPQEPE